MARAIGRATSTVQSWKDRQSIPDEHKPHVLQVALAHGYCVTPSDFFPSLQTSEDAA